MAKLQDGICYKKLVKPNDNPDKLIFMEKFCLGTKLETWNTLENVNFL
jgi:hypothetical protein